ncbi:MAG: phosphoethanolamine transferase [Prevotella sp.]|nr:phosphoethanolamine transferase [Prevotella sp.]
MNVWHSLMLIPLLWVAAMAVYLGCNHGLAPNARLQQLLRYMVASVVAAVPLAVTNTSPLQPAVVLALFVAFCWMVTYPLTFHLTNRKTAPDYDHQIDPAFGIYLFGWLTGLLLLPKASYVMGTIMFLWLLVCVVQWGYYVTCHACLDASGMKMLQETHYNEILEFLRSYSPLRVLAMALLVLMVAFVCICVPLHWAVVVGDGSAGNAFVAGTQWWQTAAALAVVAFITYYMLKPRRGLLLRTGIVKLAMTVREYVSNNQRYRSEQQQRLHTLEATTLHPLASPHTIMLVIGESASRDFMSAFVEMEEDTTPWLRQLSRDERHCLLFHNAYSCDIQTVPTLEKALTEYNQYDGGQFYTSCSIVDVAHRLGYRVHWYSNQGHLGAADTPITLVAETADVAKWTHQELGKPQYDEALVDFLSEVDPLVNNLVVLHLKGSHFNYENRFTEATRQWGAPGSHDKITNYKNTLFYTDRVLSKAFCYARERLNMQALVYFSDHADVPDRHRQPNFGGFRDTRIPLMVWMADGYIEQRRERAEALRRNKDRYWTNDLAYELLCGLMDASSSHYREENSLASTAYRFNREDLTAMDGKIRIKNDNPEYIASLKNE